MREPQKGAIPSARGNDGSRRRDPRGRGATVSSRERPGTPWKRRLFGAVAILLGTTLALLILEVGLRLLSPVWLEQRMRELNAGESHDVGSDQRWPFVKENGHFRQFPPRASFTVHHYEYQHEVTIDELGGRTTPYPPSPEALIPVVGDSFAFGLGVEDPETFVSLLAAQSPYRWVNLGIPGSALHDHLNIVQMRHAELGSPPLYVFTVFMGNDLSDVVARHQRSSASGSVGGGLGFRANLFVFHNPLLKQLYAIQFLRQKVLALMNRGGTGYMQPVFQMMRTDRPHLEDALVHWREELKRLEVVAARRGFRYFFVLIPDVHQIDPQRLAAKAASYGLGVGDLDPGRLSRAFTETLDEFGVPYFDIEPCLSEAMTAGSFYVQDNHFTAAGHAQAARCILQSGLMEAVAATLPSSAGIESRQAQ